MAGRAGSSSGIGLRPAGHVDVRQAARSRPRNTRLSSRRHPPPRIRHRRRPRRLRALRVRAARDAGVREHRDAARQATAKRATSSFSRSCKRGEHEATRRGRPRAALRPDGAAARASSRSTRTSCRGSSSATRFSRCGAPIGRRAAASASSTSATSTRSARRRRSSRRSCSAAVSEVLTTLGFGDFAIRLNHRRAADGAARGRRRVRRRSTATRWWRSTSWTRSARDGVAQRARGARHRARRPARRALTLFVAACRRELRRDGAGAARRAAGRTRGVGEPRRRSSRLAASDAGGRPASASIRAWRAGCHTTRARSWRSPCRPGIGSLGGGGRYDNLIGMFLGRDVPACGFSLGLERIIVVMTERSMFPPRSSRGGVDVMVTLWNDESRAEALRAGRGARGAAACASTCIPRPTKLGKQFKYAVEPRRRRSWRSSATNERARARWRSRTCRPASRRQCARDAGRGVHRELTREHLSHQNPER